MTLKVHLPWTDRNPAEWAEYEIPTEGGRYGWDHSREDQPIPANRRFDWIRRRQHYTQELTLLDLINDKETN